jgi:hypothetical protein
MIMITPVIVQQATPAPAAQTAAQARDQIRESVRQAIQAAQQATQDAANQTRVTVDQHGVIVRPSTPGTPGTVWVGPRGFDNIIPPQAVDIAVAFFVMCAVMVIGWPIARAFGRRLERRGQVASLDTATIGQLQRIEQAVDAMSIEIERISESQRFMARLQSESAGRGQPLPSMERR